MEKPWHPALLRIECPKISKSSSGIAAAALPTITVLVGILLNRSESSRLDARISALETGLRAEFRGEIGSLRGEMAAMRAQFHSDVLMLFER
jgi:hypothetical protein